MATNPPTDDKKPTLTDPTPEEKNRFTRMLAEALADDVPEPTKPAPTAAPANASAGLTAADLDNLLDARDKRKQDADAQKAKDTELLTLRTSHAELEKRAKRRSIFSIFS